MLNNHHYRQTLAISHLVVRTLSVRGTSDHGLQPTAFDWTWTGGAGTQLDWMHAEARTWEWKTYAWKLPPYPWLASSPCLIRSLVVTWELVYGMTRVWWGMHSHGQWLACELPLYAHILTFFFLSNVIHTSLRGVQFAGSFNQKHLFIYAKEGRQMNASILTMFFTYLLATCRNPSIKIFRGAEKMDPKIYRETIVHLTIIN
jgi:hypothetical protein